MLFSPTYGTYIVQMNRPHANSKPIEFQATCRLMKTGQEAHAGRKLQLVAMYLHNSMRSAWTAKQSNKNFDTYFAPTENEQPVESQFVGPHLERASIRPRGRLSTAIKHTRGNRSIHFAHAYSDC